MSLILEQTIEKFTMTQTKDGKLKMILEAEFAVINEKENVAHLKLPIIKFYDNGSYSSTLISETADIDLETYDVKGGGKCVVKTADNKNLQTTDLMYNSGKNLIYSNNNVEIKSPGQIIHGTKFYADTKLEKITITNQQTILC
jgi:LPS export ABC transporter protein LptC